MQKTTSKDGTKISYAQNGNGPALLLVHGTTADHSRWNKITPFLEKDFTVYAMDRRGRGESGDAKEYNILREAEDVAAVVNAIDQPIFVLGHSYGAICSLEAARLTEHIRRLILYEPPLLHTAPEKILNTLQKLTDEGKNESVLELFFRKVVQMPEEELVNYRKLSMWKKRVLIAPTIARELGFSKTYKFQPHNFKDIKVPTMLLHGELSPPIYLQEIDLIKEALPQSSVVSLDGQYHVAMDMNPELFLQKVKDFLLQ